ncbi:MAG: helix-turn-helix transcriptional regulator [Bacteroidales bacterium]|nr:helix-turn-helix transcriptional regulator [Bacteroidales bacterium]
MQIHIGKLIRDELRRQGHTNQWLMERIGVSERTLQRLFNKPTIDTQQLILISTALGVDFFLLISRTLSSPPDADTRQHLTPSN